MLQLFVFQFFYDSEKDLQNKDILKDIKKGVRLKHVRTNDRSRPNLRGDLKIGWLRETRISKSL